jgi:chromosome partitioning protein
LADYAGRLATSIPILVLANQKGGVGKTTTAANVAAAWASQGKRILVVDLDYQGSFTHLARYQVDDQTAGAPSLVNRWLEAEQAINFSSTIIEITPNLHYVPCGYAFENFERQLEYSWILGREPVDIRYRLASVLQLPFIQEQYDCVILDAPPRLTTGFINGFAAATHLYVPTVIDRLSVTAVLNFAKTFVKLHPKVNPTIKLAGVVGTMTWVNRLAKNVEPIAAQVDQHLRAVLQTEETYFLKGAVIKRDTSITQCAGIAYLKNDAVRPMFDRLAELMDSQINSRKPNGKFTHVSRSYRTQSFNLELR